MHALLCPENWWYETLSALKNIWINWEVEDFEDGVGKFHGSRELKAGHSREKRPYCCEFAGLSYRICTKALIKGKETYTYKPALTNRKTSSFGDILI
jgi:hypothetical protein